MSTTVALPPAGTALPTRAPDRLVVVESIGGFSRALDAARASGRSVGLVPTMGALHDGHRALIRRAATECDVAAVSIFVNPTQFGDPADLAGYPRTFDADLALAASAGARVVFAPSVEEMYPDGARTTVSLSGFAERWEGASRPGHFDGVATVVVKLLAMAGQQLALVRRVVADLSLPTVIVGCETVRDGYGLALSSRNARLTAAQRTSALALSRALHTGAALLAAGERVDVVEAAMADVVGAAPGVDLDYAAVVRAEDLEPVGTVTPGQRLRLIAAATVGPVRLIDNLDPHRSH
jgi:pantoate--beta-alanine ligase